MALPITTGDTVVGMARHHNGDIVVVTRLGAVYRLRWEGHLDTFTIITD